MPIGEDSHQLNKIDIVPHQCMPEALVMALRLEGVREYRVTMAEELRNLPIQGDYVILLHSDPFN